MKKQALILFTSHYPFYAQDITSEQGLMQTEVEYLARSFEPLIIAPSAIRENKLALPEGVVIDTSWSEVHRAPIKNPLIRLLNEPPFFSEILSQPQLWLKPKVIKKLAKTALWAYATRDWALALIQQRGLDPESTCFYTYWFGNITLGIGLAKQKLPGICLVSRAHRGDLYFDQWPYNYPSYRAQILHLLDRLFLISEHGRNYITSAYPWAKNMCEVSRLGVRDCNFLNPGSTDGIFRIVSCSSLTPVKRVHLLLHGIAQAALECPSQLFEWHHLGSGSMAEELTRLASQTLPGNVSWKFHGNLPNEEVVRFYRNNPVDLFVNVSSSEGLPVSMMEAACHGIPIMATAVGGTPEIVSAKNGRLLNSDPTPAEIAAALLDLMAQPQFRSQAGKFSRAVWQSDFDADRNYSQFVERLKNIRAEKSTDGRQ